MGLKVGKRPGPDAKPEPWHLRAYVAPAVINETEQNALILPLRAIAAMTFEDAWFEFDSSFILPEAVRPFARFAEVRDQYPGARLALFGHADPTGAPDYNKKLSGRRARAVYGALMRDTKEWEALYQERLGTDNWKRRPVQQMLLALGYDPGSLDGVIGKRSKAAIKAFQKQLSLRPTGSLNPTTREELFKEYMDLICRAWDDTPYQLETADLLAEGSDSKHRVDLQGCSECNPTVIFSKTETKEFAKRGQRARRDLENAPNRRVTLHLFEPHFIVDPGRWPCPLHNEGTSDCKNRYWSDGEARLKPGETRRVQKMDHDTYACRFYERVTLTAPPIGEGTATQRLRAHWSKSEVEPLHNTGWPAATPPTDAVPEECKVELLVDTIGVPDGTAARLQVKHAESRAAVTGGEFTGLEVREGRVVDPGTGEPPVFIPTAGHKPWKIWDKPFFYFEATVGGVTGESPRDYVNDPAPVLRVRWWHSMVCDALADAGGLTTAAELRDLTAIIGPEAPRAIGKTAFKKTSIKASEWGSVLRNSYAYHHASHGWVICRQCGDFIELPRIESLPLPATRGIKGIRKSGRLSPPVKKSLCPNDPAHTGQSVIAIDKGPSYLGETEAADTAAVPSTPRYLVYLNMCLAGWEPSLAKAFLARGTRNVIAFRKSIPDTQAVELARLFYKSWAQTYQCDPEKIPDVFFQVTPPYVTRMNPILYGTAGGAALATASATGAAIAAALGG